MLILLIGPKGSGKSHVGRVLAERLGVHFCHVEPLWMGYYEDCRREGREPDLGEGSARVGVAVAAALGRHPLACVETTGASRVILDDLRRIGARTGTLLVKVSAPLPLCLERIAARDPTHQIPMDAASIEKVHELGRDLDLPFDLVLENVALTDEEIVGRFAALLPSAEEG